MFSFNEFVNKKNPKKELFDQFGKYKVFVVNGKSVRDNSPQLQEFGGSSIHAYLSQIPKDEIWIEDDVMPEERDLLIHSALYQLRQIELGKSPKKAYSDGIKKEKDYRESLSLSKKQPYKTNKPAPKDVYIKKYGTMSDEDIVVWIVDGEKIRNTFKSDFIEGGQPMVYGFVPNNEIWIEYSPHKDEFPYILLHEYLERTIMKCNKIPYEKAHSIAAKCEWEMRCKTPGPITKGYSKEKALSLTKEQVLKMAEKPPPDKI